MPYGGHTFLALCNEQGEKVSVAHGSLSLLILPAQNDIDQFEVIE